MVQAPETEVTIASEEVQQEVADIQEQHKVEEDETEIQISLENEVRD